MSTQDETLASNHEELNRGRAVGHILFAIIVVSWMGAVGRKSEDRKLADVAKKLKINTLNTAKKCAIKC